ncbi:cation transport protein-domain-containing protein [Thelephora terrestris]|uniref:Potassium transport protein n=1 Tax=Thelephora terrestris TaxID=56493 RepID=A0A9P6L422_9AGAM|nr:cation transport protein-domain-containing protein [Thelephora terrestris]
MPSLDDSTTTEKKGRIGSSGSIYSHLNFFRVHLLAFTFVPLIFSAIFYASNGTNYVSYTDALFICVSSATVTGLATIDLSMLTTWQQCIAFILMFLGSPIVVSWVMVLIRRRFLAKELRARLAARDKSTQRKANPELNPHTHRRWWSSIPSLLHRSNTLHDQTDGSDSSRSSKNRPIQPDMIRRVDEKPKPINPSGWISQGRLPIATAGLVESESIRSRSSTREQQLTQSPEPIPDPHSSGRRSNDIDELESGPEVLNGIPRRERSLRCVSDLGEFPHPTPPLPRPRNPSVARTLTVEFAPSPQLRGRHQAKPSVGEGRVPPSVSHRGGHVEVSRSATFTQPGSAHPHRSSVPAIRRGYGGFPMPYEMISSAVHKLFPNMERRIKRTVTVPASHTLTSLHLEGGQQAAGSRPVNYITFNALVGRNSTFPDLTHEQIEELCGIEFKALNCLVWIVPCYYLINQLVWFIVIAPYMSLPRWKPSFAPPNLYSNLSPVWFSLFQVVSAFTNTGFSLVDQSMVPFQQAYPMIVGLIILIIAGNTGYPVLLRFTIWSLLKLTPARFGLKEPLTFLLDHPRRCFVYLFPSHQTWFLFTVVLGLIFTDWFFFLVLDIGNSAIEQIPLSQRVLLGLLQASAVRASGFASVPLAALAPGVKVLYVVTMYVSIYPIAMSVRSTNVYEENSLGVYEEDMESVDENFTPAGSTATVWSRYLALHMRKQLSFDMWWLALALFLVCIIERPGLTNPANIAWFNIFAILFEVVSAYGTVGLSLGIPTENYSLSGAFHPLSKLIICLVMLRGRHRGLPVAIDRAVMLPELKLDDEMTLQRRGSLIMNPAFADWNPHGDSASLRPAPTIHDSSVREDS